MKNLTLIICLIPVMALCQIKEEDYYLNELKKVCANPDIIEIESKTDYIEIEYICNGNRYELMIDKKSDVVFTETEAAEESLSVSMMKKLNKNFPGWTIDEFSKVIINDTILYKVEIIKDGMEQNVYFTTTGKLFKNKNFLASDTWTGEVLKSYNPYNPSDYDFLNPDNTYDLPDVLKEISGISVKETGKIYCVQDEIGSVFLYDLNNESISEIYSFTDVGDFEDISYNNGDIAVLRSDGAIFQFSLSGFPENITIKYLPFRTLSVEGITYDKKNQSFLFACHENNVNENINNKFIYRYLPDSKSNFIKEFHISVDSVNRYFKKNYPSIKISSINFSPSAIAVHPVTANYYILSATDRMLVIVDKSKRIKSIHPLPSNIFYKPEGIDFYQNGDMLISNEGTQNGLIKPNILTFKYKALKL